MTRWLVSAHADEMESPNRGIEMSKMPAPVLHIGNRQISLNDPVYFIAEIGSNFDQDLGRAKELIHLAKEAGADAAKFQHYTASSLVSDFGFRQLGGQKSHQAAWKQSVFDTYKAASLNENWTLELKQACDEAEIAFFTSPYSFELVDYVAPHIPAFKVGSGDITWIEIVQKIASKGKPVLLATGASDLADVRRAVDAILSENDQLVLMQCNTNYTADTENFSHLHLNTLKEFAACYPDVILGLSDHMPGHVSVLGAVALGARVVEKHFTDSIDRDGPDHPFSMTPSAWREMVDRTRELESALGDSHKRIETNEIDTAILQRRCIRVNKEMQSGAVLSSSDLTVLRPCPENGIPPYEMENIVGKKLTRSIADGDHLRWEDLC